MSTSLPDPFSGVTGLDEETRRSAEYFFNNHHRGRADDAVVQQTLGGACFYEDAAGRRLVQVDHAMLFTHDENSSYGYPPDTQEPYRLRYMSFRLAALRPWWERLRAEFGSIVQMPEDGEAAAILRELTRRFRAREFRDRLQESELLHQLLVALYRGQIAAQQNLDPVEYGRHLLRDHFRSPVNLKEIADRCGICREHFTRSFSERYGEPPGEMLRRLRLEHASRMLQSTHLPVQEIALACGFADANTFCRAYRRAFGIAPGASRPAAAPGLSKNSARKAQII